MKVVDVDTVILNVADVASVVRDSFRYCQMLAAFATRYEERENDDDDENDD